MSLVQRIERPGQHGGRRWRRRLEPSLGHTVTRGSAPATSWSIRSTFPRHSFSSASRRARGDDVVTPQPRASHSTIARATRSSSAARSRRPLLRDDGAEADRVRRGHRDVAAILTPSRAIVRERPSLESDGQWRLRTRGRSRTRLAASATGGSPLQGLRGVDPRNAASARRGTERRPRAAERAAGTRDSSAIAPRRPR